MIQLEGLELEGLVQPPTEGAVEHPSTLVLLHGYGAHAGDLLGLRDEIDPGLRCVALQAPHDLGPMGMPGGHAWFHLSVTGDGDISYDTDGAMASLNQLSETVPQAVAQAGGSSTIVLGFSQGAMLGHGLALQSEVELAGLAACSGRLVPEIFAQRPLAVPKGFPVFLSHGTHDEIIPVSSGHAIRAAYEEASEAHVTWIEEPIGHGIGPACLQGLHEWFINRR